MTRLQYFVGLCALGSAGAGGVFFAFSTFVMPALGRLSSQQAIVAMQQINITAVRPAFMTLLFGTAALLTALLIWAVPNRGTAEGKLVIAAVVIYLIGIVGLTGAFHVPRNDALAILDPTAANAASEWRDYLSEWTAANHVRTFSGFASAALLIAALRRMN